MLLPGRSPAPGLPGAERARLLGALHVHSAIDGFTLEERLVRAVVERPHGGLEEPILVLAPTLRLLDHLKWKVARAAPAVLGAQFQTFRGLARRSLELALLPAPRLLPRIALEELLGSLAPAPLAPGDQSQLLSLFGDLREAGLTASTLGEVPRFPRPTRELLESLEREFARLESDELTDDAGLVRRAIPHVLAFLEQASIRRVIVAPVYELVGSHVELVRAMASVVEVEVLVPGDLGNPRLAHAAHLLRALGVEEGSCGASPADPARRTFIERLGHLDDPDFLPGSPLESPALEVQHAQGARGELEAVALRVLALHRDEGVPLDDILVVARSLEPYALELEPVLAEQGLPFTTSVTRSPRRQPGLRAFFSLLGTLSTSLERRAFIEILQSPVLALPGVDRGLLRADHWDRESRKRRLDRGLDSWRGLLETSTESVSRGDSDDDDRSPGEDPAGEDPGLESARAELARALDFLEEQHRAWKSSESLDDHRRFLLELHRAVSMPLLPPEVARSDHRRLEALLERLELLELVRARTDRRSRWRPGEVGEKLARLLDEESLPLESDRPGGLRVLDLMQARGLTARVVIWMGFQADQFPRRGGSAGLLDDSARVTLVESTGAVLYPRLEAPAEERLLLASLLGSTGVRLILSFQRADEMGSRKGRSSALREVARVFLGKPDASALVEESAADSAVPVTRLPAHRGERARILANSSRFARVATPDAILVHAASEGGRDSVRAFLDGARDLLGSSGEGFAWTEREQDLLRIVDRIESFEEPAGLHDGMTSIPLSSRFTFSPTSLELLSNCPQLFFLKYILGVSELDPEPLAHRLESRVLGSAVHDFLAELFEGLAARELFPLDDDTLVKAREEVELALRERWPAHLARASGPSHRRLHRLHDFLARTWEKRLREFLVRDLEQLRAAGKEPVAFEEKFSCELSAPGGLARRLGGRLDRIFRSGETLCVDDYKTAGKVGEWVKAKVLQGEKIQLPLYCELLIRSGQAREGRVEGRLLSLDARAEARKLVGQYAAADDLLVGFRETLEVVLGLADRGHYPAPPETPHCDYCGFRGSCRHLLGPTRHRYETSEVLENYRLSRRKTTRPKLFTLAEVRAAQAAGTLPEEDEE